MLYSKVIEKETEASEKDLIELSDEGFDFVEDSNFVIEGIEKIRSESKNCATLESVRNEVTEIADQSICQDIENMGCKVEIIESFQERANEEYVDELSGQVSLAWNSIKHVGLLF